MEQGSISALVGQRPWIGPLSAGDHRPRYSASLYGIGFVGTALYGLTALAATAQREPALPRRHLHRLEDPRMVIGRRVYARGDWPYPQPFRRKWREQIAGVRLQGRQPPIIAIARQDYGHAVVNGRNQIIGWTGDDAKGTDVVSSFRVFPILPNTSEREG